MNPPEYTVIEDVETGECHLVRHEDGPFYRKLTLDELCSVARFLSTTLDVPSL